MPPGPRLARGLVHNNREVVYGPGSREPGPCFSPNPVRSEVASERQGGDISREISPLSVNEVVIFRKLIN